MRRMLAHDDMRRQNRRVGLILIAALVALYIIAVIGVIVLNSKKGVEEVQRPTSLCNVKHGTLERERWTICHA